MKNKCALLAAAALLAPTSAYGGEEKAETPKKVFLQLPGFARAEQNVPIQPSTVKSDAELLPKPTPMEGESSSGDPKACVGHSCAGSKGFSPSAAIVSLRAHLCAAFSYRHSAHAASKPFSPAASVTEFTPKLCNYFSYRSETRPGWCGCCPQIYECCTPPLYTFFPVHCPATKPCCAGAAAQSDVKLASHVTQQEKPAPQTNGTKYYLRRLMNGIRWTDGGEPVVAGSTGSQKK